MTEFTTRTPVQRPSDLIHPEMLSEFRRLASLSRRTPLYELVVYNNPAENRFHIRWAPGTRSWLLDAARKPSDMANMVGLTNWIAEGPKIVNVTEAQYQAMANVEVRLDLSDYRQPYPTVLVNLPPGHLHHCCLMSILTATDGTKILTTTLMSPDNTNNVATFISSGRVMDASLGKFGADCADLADRSVPNLRVATNMMLAMVNFGCHPSYLFPAEVEQERKYVAKGDRPSRDGRRASDRLAEQPVLVSLDHSVELWHREGSHEEGSPTGREMPFHWRRGHWRRAHVGAARAETKLVFVRPCMVRADLLTVTPEDTTTTYWRE